MTVATVTICGEDLTAEDLEQLSKCPRIRMSKAGALLFDFFGPGSGAIRIDQATPDKQELIANHLCCWFLDRAEEVREKAIRTNEGLPSTYDGCDGWFDKYCPQYFRYLASAAKWAQIGRNAK